MEFMERLVRKLQCLITRSSGDLSLFWNNDGVKLIVIHSSPVVLLEAWIFCYYFATMIE